MTFKNTGSSGWGLRVSTYVWWQQKVELVTWGINML